MSAASYSSIDGSSVAAGSGSAGLGSGAGARTAFFESPAMATWEIRRQPSQAGWMRIADPTILSPKMSVHRGEIAVQLKRTTRVFGCSDDARRRPVRIERPLLERLHDHVRDHRADDRAEDREPVDVHRVQRRVLGCD